MTAPASDQSNGNTAAGSGARRRGLPATQRLLRGLALAVTNASLYPASHGAVKTAQVTLLTAIRTVLAQEPETSLELMDGEFCCEGIPILGVADQAAVLRTWFAGLDIEIVKFEQGIGLQDIATFVSFLATSLKPSDHESGDCDTELTRHGIEHVHVGKLAVRGPRSQSDVHLPDLRQIYQAALQAIKTLMLDVRRGRRLDVQAAQSVVVDIVHRMLHEKDNVLALSMIRTYDEYLFVHSVNVTILTLSLAETFLTDEQQLIDVGKAALLHDIGKTLIAPEILEKSTPLDESEWAVVRQHPVDGMALLENSHGGTILASLIALEHHRWADGSGYPARNFDQDSNPFAMLVSIADCYDALTTNRPYRKVLTPKSALQVMAGEEGAHFKPRLLRRFFDMIGVYPLGSLVQLNTGEVGVVRKRNPADPERPQVLVVRDADGKPLAEDTVVDLARRDGKTGDYARSIEAELPYTSAPGVDVAAHVGRTVPDPAAAAGTRQEP